MYAAIAFIPIVFTVIVMAGFNWPANAGTSGGMADYSNFELCDMEDADTGCCSVYNFRIPECNRHIGSYFRCDSDYEYAETIRCHGGY